MIFVLCFVAILTVGASSICDDECKLQQRAALETLYQSLHGEHWARREGWESGSLDHCSWAGVRCCVNQSTATGLDNGSRFCPLPGGVVALELALNNATGPWPASALAGLSDSLAYLNMRGNKLKGQLPATVSNLSQLSVLYIDNTGLSGSLPAELGQMLNLTQLSAAGNMFTGSVPASLSSLQRLRRLSLQNNQLTGQFPGSLLALPQLQQLDVSCNQLTWQLQTSGLDNGATPADAFSDAALGALATPARQMSEVNFSTNKLAGPLPTSVALLPTIMLDLSYNQLSGSIPAAAFGSNPVLQELFLAHNRLVGTLSPQLFSGDLHVLDLSSNALTGTLPSLSGVGASIVQLDLSNNSFVGPLPIDVTGQLGSLRWVNLAGNRLASLPQGLLSQGLKVDSSAPAVAIDPSSSPGLLCQPIVSADSSSSRTVIQLDPATYGYEGCFCQAPLHADKLQQGGNTVSLICVADQQAGSGVPLANILGPLLAVLVAALLALVLVFAAWRGGLASFVQRITIESEKKMPPSAAKDITLVLTDVQGSTELWEWDQQLASDAFKVHDRILRQYMTQFYGYEVSTEGDAFLVAFHEPFDAVAWCLCVQLALHYADWPEPLLLHKSTCMDTAETLELKRRERQTQWQNRLKRAAAAAPGSAFAQAAAAAAAAGASATARMSRNCLQPGAGAVDVADAAGGVDDHVQDSLPPAPLVAVDQDPGAAFEDAGLGGVSSSDNALEERMAAEYAALGNNKDGGRSLLFRGLRVRMSIATGGVDSVRLHSVTQRAEYVGEVLRKVQAVGETPQGGQVMMDSDTFRGIHSRLPELGGVVLEATQKLLRNNRAAGPNAQELVEMFSQMPPAATNSEALQRSDFITQATLHPNHTTDDNSNPNAAHSTITVRPNVAENGSKGVNDQASAGSGAAGVAKGVAESAGQQMGSWSAAHQFNATDTDIEKGRMNSSPTPRVHRGLLHQAAQLLGLHDDDSVSCSVEGLYGASSTLHDSPSGSPLPASPKGIPAPGLGGLIGGGIHLRLKGLGLHAPSLNVPGLRHAGQGGRRRRRSEGGRAVRRRSSLSYSVMVIDMGVHQLSGLAQKVNLIQVMPCGLEDRARFFSRLDSIRQETPGYFDAPAAGLVPLSPGSITAGVTMPNVTIVFCTVDKYCEIVEVNRDAAELALELYSDCVRWLLLVGGGYECQEAEGTFMVAFSSADVAIEWCLMVQQVLRDMSWPASVLELPTCEEERDMHGSIMFRGPRVKMGIYSGTPTRVIPHTTTGRADYFGPLVNRAARYCHAAARGGQVLVPKELMCDVIGKWVLIDPTELMQSDRLLEFVAYFDEERRLWPWMFKRRKLWDFPMPPQLYPQQSPETLQPEDALANAGLGSSQQQQLGQWWNLGEHACGPADADGGAAAGIGVPGSTSMLQPSGKVATAVSAAAVNSKEQLCNVDGLAAVDEMVKSSSEGSSQHHSSLSDLMPVRLAPLHETAECSSSKCASDGEASTANLAMSPALDQQAQQQLPHLPQPQQLGSSGPAAPGLPPGQPRQYSSKVNEPLPAGVRGVRHHSDLAQAVSRLGPQGMQQLQFGQYIQPGTSPVGLQSTGNPLGPSVPYSPAGWRQAGLSPSASVAAALMAQQSRYRRPSYLSDLSASARYRRFSNMSDSSSMQYSSAGATMSSGTGFAVGWGGLGGGPSSRRNSAMSDFFPVGHHSRRPSSQLSADMAGFLSPPGIMDAPMAAAAQQTPMQDGVPGYQQVQSQQHILPLLHVSSQQQHQLPYCQQQLLQMHQRGAVVGPSAYPGQPAAIPGLAGPHQYQLAGGTSVAGAASSNSVVQQQQQEQTLQAGVDYASEATANNQQQHIGPVSAGTAAGHHGRKSNLSQGGLRLCQQQQQLPHSGPASLPGGGDSGQNSTTLSNPVHSSSTGGSRGSGGGRPVPAAMMLQGLESQVLPGMLHSSNRLRLVSKRRRQMSYCFFQESSKPGIPAEGNDPRKVLPVGHGSAAATGMGLGSLPPSNYAGSEAATSMNGDRPGVGFIALGSLAGSHVGTGRDEPLSVTGAPTSAGSGGVGSAGVSRRGSVRSDSNCESGIGELGSGSGDEGAVPAAPTSGGKAPEPHTAAYGGAGGVPATLASRVDESCGVQSGDVGAAGTAADGAWMPAAATWGGGGNSIMDNYCGLPEIDPLPDVDVMESLRLSVPQRGHRTSTMSTTTGIADSVIGFEGPSIGNMCADIMRGRWLWIRELLVHDLGQFKFKGIAGVHSIVSVTSEELGGRTFPTTIRRGKGEQIRLGRGLLALVQVDAARTKAPLCMGSCQGQQLVHNPAPPVTLSEQQQHSYSPALNMCHACGSVGTGGPGQPMMSHLCTGHMQSADGFGQQQMMHTDPNHSIHSSQLYMGDVGTRVGLQRAACIAGTYGPAVAAAFNTMPGRMRRGGSLGDLRLAHQAALAAATAAGQDISAPLQHCGSAPESVATSALEAATAPGILSAASSVPQGMSRGVTTGTTTTPAEIRSAGSSGAGQPHAGWHEEDTITAALPHCVHPRHTPSQAAQQFWQMQTHLWQLQLQQQQQRQRQKQQQQQRRRRHSVCMGSMQSRFWTRPYGVMGEMMPFQEIDEWSVPASVTLPSPTPQQQHGQQQLAQDLGRDVLVPFANMASHSGTVLPPSAAAELSCTLSAQGSQVAPAVLSPLAAGSSSVIDDDDAHNASDVASVGSDALDVSRAKAASRRSHSASAAASVRDEPQSAR